MTFLRLKTQPGSIPGVGAIYPAVGYYQKLSPRDTFEELKYALLTTLMSTFNEYLNLGWLDSKQVLMLLKNERDIQSFLKPKYQNTFIDNTIANKNTVKLSELSKLINFVSKEFTEESKVENSTIIGMSIESKEEPKVENYTIIDKQIKALFEVAIKERNSLNYRQSILAHALSF